ncbi:hypothetical protein K438DRAFT_1712024 [Mycena galopus ATCC 62051]|nr:hypothetical protein K438DRAFT_1712024 [Mycena galopus ATCC 62051]
MRLTSLLATLAAAAVASAQDQTIMVGGNETNNGNIYQFSPTTITATNGSVITFLFNGLPGNHSVTQSSFSSPCQPMAGGFGSGWVEILTSPPTGNALPTWELTITNASAPIWFFCQQLMPIPHCTAGMVGAINVQPGANSFSAFQSAALKAGTVGEGQNGLVGIGASASAEPVIPSEGVTLFIGPSATATAPAGGSNSGSAAASASAPAGSAPPSGAVAIGFNFNSLIILSGVIVGAVMVL